MDAVPLSAAQVLDAFFLRARFLRHPALRGRGDRVYTQLRRFLEVCGEQWMTGTENSLLAAERQIEPAGAVVRTMSPESLLSALPEFLAPHWMLTDAFDAGSQVRVVAALRVWLLEWRVVDAAEMEPGLLELDAAVDAARRRLAAGRRLDSVR